MYRNLHYLHYKLQNISRHSIYDTLFLVNKGQITISSDPSPLFGIQFLAIPFAFDFAFKKHIKEKSFKHSIN